MPNDQPNTDDDMFAVINPLEMDLYLNLMFGNNISMETQSYKSGLRRGKSPLSNESILRYFSLITPFIIKYLPIIL